MSEYIRKEQAVALADGVEPSRYGNEYDKFLTAFANAAIQHHIDSQPAPELTESQKRMLADFPRLQQFHTKHALGPMAAPSCLCCGQQTIPYTRPIAVKHMELLGIVICKQCKDAADAIHGIGAAAQPAA